MAKQPSGEEVGRQQQQADDQAQKVGWLESKLASLRQHRQSTKDAPEQNRRDEQIVDVERQRLDALREREVAQQDVKGAAQSAQPTNDGWHGPYHHQLNKGGLEDIQQNQRMLSTEARSNWGGRAGVRAYDGPHQPTAGDGAREGHTTIEFYTRRPPDSVHPTNRTARWDVEEGEYLDVNVSKVHQVKNGRTVTTDHGAPGDSRQVEEGVQEKAGAAKSPKAESVQPAKVEPEAERSEEQARSRGRGR